MPQRHRRASASRYGKVRNLDYLRKPQMITTFLFGQKARSRLARHGEYQIERKLVSRCSSMISLTTIYLKQLRHSNASLLYLTSFISQCVDDEQAHLHLTILIVLSFEEKGSRRNSIMSNQDNLDYDNYSTTKLEFEKFNAFKDNNRLRNNDKDNSLNIVKASTLHQQIETLMTKIRGLRNAQQV